MTEDIRGLMTRTLLQGLPALLVLVLVTGCGRGGDEQVLATVGPEEITLTRFVEYHRTSPSLQRSVDEEYAEMSARLEDLIRYTLIELGGRADGRDREERFRKAREKHEKDLLNRLWKQREIVEKIQVSEAEIDTFLARAAKERHIQHIVVSTQAKADRVLRQLEEGQDWAAVAVAESEDPQRQLNQGDLGWLSWGEGNFAYYSDLQPIVYRIPVGTWEGPIRSGNEFHFINVLAEQDRPTGSPDVERAAARSRITSLRQTEMEQELVNRIWREGGYRVNEDQFRWILEKILESFEKDPRNNPVPVLSTEDGRRVVIHSDKDPYSAQDLLDRLEMINPQGRDNAIMPQDWRQLFVEWVLSDEVAEMARARGYQRDPAIQTALTRFTESRLYAEQLHALEEIAGIPDDDYLEEYFQEHPEQFNIPERRTVYEVLLATREEAERIRARVLAGEDIQELAAEYTIREGFRERRGRLAPISSEELMPLGAAAAALDAGEVGPVVEGPLGYSVFRVDRVNPARELSLDEMRENLREQLRMEWRRAAIDSFVDEARQRWRIRRNDDLLRQYAEELVAARAAAASGQEEPPGGTSF